MSRRPLAMVLAVGAIIALFAYSTRRGPGDGIFEQTAPKLDETLHFLKSNGEMIIGRDKIQEVADTRAPHSRLGFGARLTTGRQRL